jgi:hypothetical protein
VLFNSLHFLIFFPIVAALFFAVPTRFRLPLLFVASCYFYMAFIPAYILILFVLIAVDYVAGILIDRAQGPGHALMAQGAGLETRGQRVIRRTNLIGREGIQKLGAPPEHALMRPEEFIGRADQEIAA